jgi:FixJ family two-component response regulator
VSEKKPASFAVKLQLGDSAYGYPITKREARVISAILDGHVTRGGIAELLRITESSVGQDRKSVV